MAEPSIHTGTTNERRPFRPGDIILYDNVMYEVIENWGTRGKVRLYPPVPARPDAFTLQWHDEDWSFLPSVLLLPAEDRPDLGP